MCPGGAMPNQIDCTFDLQNNVACNVGAFWQASASAIMDSNWKRLWKRQKGVLGSNSEAESRETGKGRQRKNTSFCHHPLLTHFSYVNTAMNLP